MSFEVKEIKKNCLVDTLILLNINEKNTKKKQKAGRDNRNIF